jgi:hypothetical protein
VAALGNPAFKSRDDSGEKICAQQKVTQIFEEMRMTHHPDDALGDRAGRLVQRIVAQAIAAPTN